MPSGVNDGDKHKNDAEGSDLTNAVLLLDRFVSASSSEDVESSLDRILNGLKDENIKPEWIYKDAESNTDLLLALRRIMNTGKHCYGFNNTEEDRYNMQEVPVEGGSSLACNIFLEMIKQDLNTRDVLLDKATFDPPLIETLIDIVSGEFVTTSSKEVESAQDSVVPLYTRVLGIKLLHELCKSSKAQKQLLEAPNGLHRIADLLDLNQQPVIRNEVLLLAQTIAEKWPSCCQIWMFGELAEKVIQLAIEEGGLTNGNVLVLDCIQLLYNLWKHDPITLADLVFQSHIIMSNIPTFLDLRNGIQFKELQKYQKQHGDNQLVLKLEHSKKKKKRHGNLSQTKSSAPVISNDENKQIHDDDLDDLDDILNMAESDTERQKMKTGNREFDEDGNDTDDKDDDGDADDYKPIQFVPKLTTSEEEIIISILNVLALMLESDSARETVWKRHVGLSSLIWELALMSPPQSSFPFACAYPSSQLQQKALEVVSQHLNDATTMERHSGLDRLLYIMCTGGMASKFEQKVGLSQAALHVLRKTLSSDVTNQMLLHTLAPPTTIDDENEENGQPQIPSTATVVLKLLNTAVENLSSPSITATSSERANVEKNRLVFLLGSLSALEVFLTDETSREVFLRLTTPDVPPPLQTDQDKAIEHPVSMIDSILFALANPSISDISDDGKKYDEAFSMILLRFLCHWAMETPSVVHAILSSSQSTVVLSTLIKHQSKSVATLTWLLLGLCMEYMINQNETSAEVQDEEKSGGWTRASIMDMITTKKGVSNYMRALEHLKSNKNTIWSSCKLEFNVWMKWYVQNVLLVRKRVVQELTGGTAIDDEDDDDSEIGEGVFTADNNLNKSLPSAVNVSTAAGSNGGVVCTNKSMAKLISQQAKEIEQFQASLSNALDKNDNQEKKLETWKLRIESTPTELDTLFNQSIMKNEQLSEQINTLEQKTLKNENKFQLELKNSNDQISKIENELDESKEACGELGIDYNNVKEEMTALSKAYTSLEEEYQHLKEREDEMTKEKELLEKNHQEAQQGIPGMMTTAIGATEINALRAENERLKNDTKEADSWMAMAVTRMNNMMQQNTALEKEVIALKQQPDVKGHHDDDQKKMEKMMVDFQREQKLREELENKLEKETNLVQSISHSYEETIKKNQYDFELEIANSSTTVQKYAAENESLHSEIQKIGLSQKDDVSDQLKEITNELNIAHVEIQTLREHSKKVEKEFNIKSKEYGDAINKKIHSSSLEVQKNGEVNTLKCQLEESNKHRDEREKALNKKIQELQGEVQSYKSEHIKEEEEIYKCENKIRELEARIFKLGGSDGAGNGAGNIPDEMESKDEEISQLRQANESAQEWMSKAVEHHQMLSEQLTTIGDENTSLKTQMKELRDGIVKNENVVKNGIQLQEQIDKQLHEINHVKEQYDDGNNELQSLQTQLSIENEQKTLLELNIGKKEKDLLDATNEIQSLVEKIDGIEKEKDSLLSTRNDFDAKENEMKSLHQQIMEEKERNQKDFNIRNEEINSLREELDQLKKKLTIVEEKGHETSQNLERKLSSIEMEKKDLNDILQKSKSEINYHIEENDQMKKEAQILRENIESQKNEIEQDAQEIYEREQEEERLRDSLAEAQDKIDHLRNKLEQGSARAAAAVVAVTEDHNGIDEHPRSIMIRTKTNNPITKQEESDSDDNSDIEHLCDEVKALREENDALERLHDDDRSLVDKLSSEAFELRIQNEALTAELGVRKFAEGELQDALSLIATEEQIAELEDENNSLKKRLSDAMEQLQDHQHHLHQSDELLDKEEAIWQETVSSLETDLSKSINENESQKAQLIQFQLQLKQMELELIEADKSISHGENVVQQWTERVAELEIIVNNLEEQLQEQENDANDVILQWEESFEALNKKNQTLESKIENDESVGQLQTQIRSLQDEKNTIEECLTEQMSNIQLQNDQLNERIGLLEIEKKNDERMEEMKGLVQDMEEQLENQEKDANTTAEEWHEKCLKVEKINLELKNEVECTKDERINALQLSESKVEKLSEHVEVYRVQVREAEERSNELLESIQTGKKQSEQKVSSLEEIITKTELQMHNQENDAKKRAAEWKESFDIEHKELRENVFELESKIRDLEHHSKQLLSDGEEKYAILNDLNLQLAKDAEIAKKIESAQKQMIVSLQIESGEQESNFQNQAEICNEKIIDLEKIRLVVSDLEEKLCKCNLELLQSQNQTNNLTKMNESLQDTGSDKDRVAEMNTTIADMERKLQKHERTCKQFQDRCMVLEGKNEQLAEELEAVSESRKEQDLAVKDLEEHVEKQNDEHQKLQDRYVALELETENLDAELEKALENIKNSTQHMEQTKSLMTDRQTKIEELEDLYESVVKEIDEGMIKNKTVEKTLEAKNDSIESQRKYIEDLMDKIASLKQTVREQENELTKKKEASDEIASEWELKLKEEHRLKAALSKNKDVVEAELSNLEETLLEKEDEIELLKADLREIKENEKDSDNTEIVDLQKRLELDKVGFSEAKAEIVYLTNLCEQTRLDCEDVVNQWKMRVEELEGMVKELENQIDEEASEATEAISRWESLSSELEQEVTKLKAVIDKKQSSVSLISQVLSSEFGWKKVLLSSLKEDALSGIEITGTYINGISDGDVTSDNCKLLQSSLEELNDMFTGFLETLKSDSCILTERNERINEELRMKNESIESIKTELAACKSQMKAELSLKAANLEMKEEIETIKISLAKAMKIKGENENEKYLLQERMDELTEQCRESSDSIKAQLESKSSNFSEDIQSLQSELREEQSRRTHAENKIVSLESTMVNCVDMAKTERTNMKESFEEKRLMLRKVYDALNQKCNSLQSEKAALELEVERVKNFSDTESRDECNELLREKASLANEVERLRVRVGILEDELRESNDSLQIMITEEVSEIATSMAAKALREQINELRHEFDLETKALQSEQDAREMGEQENDRLKANIVALMGMTDATKLSDIVQVDAVLMKASEKIRKRDLLEMEDLQKSLSRVQEELVSSRKLQKSAEERAAKANLHASSCQQELISSKSDLKYLVQTMEEMRAGEDARRASYEHRITSLEKEHEVLRKFHSAEINNLRNELTQISMEKDRIQQALKDCEKKVFALLNATSKDHTVKGEESVAVELVKLRVERAQLLVAAAEEAARTERRLREATAAHSSSVEAEIIVERELRLAAETALSNTRLEVEHLRTEVKPVLDNSNDTKELEETVGQLKKVTKKLSDENSFLLEKRDRVEAELRIKIAQMTEECRIAQGKAQRFERESRYHSEIQMEVNNLRSPGRNKELSIGVDDNYEEDKKEEMMQPAEEVYDMIQTQRDTIEEEREMYLELLAEHDDLLALLAQQDLVKVSLCRALEVNVGQDAVEIAMQEAEEIAVSQYGKAVKLID